MKTFDLSDYLELINKDKEFLPAVIAYLESFKNSSYDELLEKLKDKYYIKRQRKLKLKIISELK